MHAFKYALLFSLMVPSLSADSFAQDPRVVLQTTWRVSTAEQQDSNGKVVTPYTQEAAQNWKWAFRTDKLTWSDGPKPRPTKAECTYTVTKVRDLHRIDIEYNSASNLLNNRTSKGIFAIERRNGEHVLTLRFFTDPEKHNEYPKSFDFKDGADCTTLILRKSQD